MAWGLFDYMDVGSLIIKLITAITLNILVWVNFENAYFTDASGNEVKTVAVVSVIEIMVMSVLGLSLACYGIASKKPVFIIAFLMDMLLAPSIVPFQTAGAEDEEISVFGQFTVGSVNLHKFYAYCMIIVWIILATCLAQACRKDSSSVDDDIECQRASFCVTGCTPVAVVVLALLLCVVVWWTSMSNLQKKAHVIGITFNFGLLEDVIILLITCCEFGVINASSS